MRDERPVKVLIFYMKQDDPKKCTSAKLFRLHLAKPIFRSSDIPSKAIVLNPVAEQVLNRNDTKFIEEIGLVAVDCSWEKADQVFDRSFPGFNRRLPLLLAGNPTNYATLSKLSSLEALAAALYITGFEAQARRFLSIFKWGPTFLSLNEELLEEYSKAEGPEKIVELERSFFH
jgi:pre-rRNA-processing protein TSR3